jgi:small-conductance mechanosensitive channel
LESFDVEEALQILTTRINVGSVSFSALSLLVGLTLLIGLFIIDAVLKRLLRERVLPRAGISRGAASSIATLCYYLVFIIGLGLIMPIAFAGFDFATLSVALGALSLGIGFGLRNIADNFVSGLILLIERPIKVGDRIEVEGVFGEVISIRARSTTVRTNDNIDIIVPNSQFVSEQVTNVSHSDNRVRYRFPIGVHYKSDVRVVEKALLEAADECADALKIPPPSVRFMAFGDSSLDFELWIWTDSLYNRPQVLRSDINFLIWEKLRKYRIEIPYPQRDLYLKEIPASLRGLAEGEGQSPESVPKRPPAKRL